MGGSGVVATELARHLALRGHELHLLSYEVPVKANEMPQNVKFHKVTVPSYWVFRFPPYTLALACHIYRVVVANKLDILHVHYAVPHSSSAMLAQQMLITHKQPTIPIVTTLHGTDTQLVGIEESYKCVVEMSIDSSDAVTAVSKNLKEETFKVFALSKNIQVIYNAIDTNKFHASEIKNDRQEKVICHISNLRPLKRVCDAINIYNEVNKHLPSRLLIVGKGPDYVAARELVYKLKLENKVHFIGSMIAVDELLRSCDLLLSTSEKESFGLTICEALATEVPVIATNIGGIPEIITNGIEGFLCELGDINSMAKSALNILTDNSLAERMGKAGRKKVIDNFSPDIIVSMYEEVYNSIM